MMMTIAMTPANTGRWMKKRDIGLALGFRLDLDRRPRAQAHQVVDDHVLSGLQAVEHDPVAADPVAGADRALRRLALGADDPHVAPALVLLHGVLRHEDRRPASR